MVDAEFAPTTHGILVARLQRNICQEDLAVAIGSCGRTIGRIERGERNATLELALRLSAYLGMSVEELFKIEDK